MMQTTLVAPSAQDAIRGYFEDIKALLDAVDAAQVARLADALFAVWQIGGRAILMGNGGSGSSVSHIVADLQKNIQLETGTPLRTLCLSDCTPLLSAWANDSEWDNVFAPQVTCWAQPGDVVIGVSGSGNSMNVIHGIEAGNRAGAKTFGLAGYEGGKLQEAAQHCLVVRCNNMQRIEDVHMAILHVVFLTVLERAREASRA